MTCPGFAIQTGTLGEALCVDHLGAPVAWEAVPEFEVSALDVTQLSGAYVAGFILIGMGWAIGRGFKYVLSMLR